MRNVLHAYRVIAYYFSFALFGAAALSLNVFCLLSMWLPATGQVERFFERLIHVHFSAWIRCLKAIGVFKITYKSGEKLADEPGGMVIVSNHPGLMDISYLLARVPEAVCIHKPAVCRNPILGWSARRAGYLASDGGVDLVRAATAKVSSGAKLIIFPEGTRTRRALNGLRPGFAVIAQRAQAPIQMVHIHCDSSLLTKGRAWWKIPRLPANVQITCGPRVTPRENIDARKIVAEVETWLRSQNELALIEQSCANAAPSPEWQTAT